MGVVDGGPGNMKVGATTRARGAAARTSQFKYLYLSSSFPSCSAIPVSEQALYSADGTCHYSRLRSERLKMDNLKAVSLLAHLTDQSFNCARRCAGKYHDFEIDNPCCARFARGR